MSKQFLSLAIGRTAVCSIVTATLVAMAAGCSSISPSYNSPTPRPASQPVSEPKPDSTAVDATPTPFGQLSAKIVSLNTDHEFVVVDFMSRLMPSIGARVDVYRNGK